MIFLETEIALQPHWVLGMTQKQHVLPNTFLPASNVVRASKQLKRSQYAASPKSRAVSISNSLIECSAAAFPVNDLLCLKCYEILSSPFQKMFSSTSNVIKHSTTISVKFASVPDMLPSRPSQQYLRMCWAAPLTLLNSLLRSLTTLRIAREQLQKAFAGI